MQGLRLHQVSGHIELHISDDLDWQLFEEIAGALEQELPGTWIGRSDGLDQSYWGLKIDSSILTLHLEHHSGIMLSASPKSLNEMAANSLLQRVYLFLQSYEPAA